MDVPSMNSTHQAGISYRIKMRAPDSHLQLLVLSLASSTGNQSRTRGKNIEFLKI